MILRLLPFLCLLLPSALADVSQRPNLGNWGVQNLEYPCWDPDRECYLYFDLVQDTASEPQKCTAALKYPKEEDWNIACSERHDMQAVWTHIPTNNLGSLLVLVIVDTKLAAFATFNIYPKMLDDFGRNAADQFQAAHYLDPDDGPTAGTTPTTADPTTVEVITSTSTVTMGAMRMEKHRVKVNTRAAQITTGPAGFLPNALVHRDDTGNNPIWQILRLQRLYKSDEKAMYFSFTINSQSGPLANCAMRIPDTDGTGSWFGKGCDAFTISWGYNRDTDGAVMTVCNAKTGQDAFFGFDNVNNPGVVYADSKWEPAGKSGCK